MSKETVALKEKIRKALPEPIFREGLSSGSTLLNLACTGRPSIGYVKGTYIWYVGDSSSGKTWVCLAALAEASISPNFKDYRLIYDSSERGALMSVKKFFGKALDERLEPPGWDKEGNALRSRTVEEFYYFLDDARKEGKPFVYILDSMDGLDTEADEKKFDQNKKLFKKRMKKAGQLEDDSPNGKEKEEEQAKGSYGTAKAKANSSNLHKFIDYLERSGSILIIVSQTRDNLQSFGYGDKKTYSGGKALKFYATLQIWTSVRENLMKTVNGKKRELGKKCRAHIVKNRVVGKDRTVDFLLYHSHGIDDIGSCIEYLIEEKHWAGKENTVVAPEFDHDGTKEKLIQKIEESGREKDLRMLVLDVWNAIEIACEVKRKNRYQ